MPASGALGKSRNTSLGPALPNTPVPREVELRANPNGNIAVESRTPDFRRMLKRDQALLAERGSRIPTHRGCRSRIIESHAGRINVDDTN